MDVSLIHNLFAQDKSVIGMIHVGALPGTPHHTQPMDGLTQAAVREAELLVESGCDAVVIENMHDRPYLCTEVGPEIVAGMTMVALAVRDVVSIPIGIQILAAANSAALAVAQAAGAGFIRAENYIFAHVADEGFMPTADAGPLLRYRRQIDAQDIAILADVKKKHASHSLTADVDLVDMARAAQFFGADGVVVTGKATGRPAEVSEVRRVRESTALPVAVGSGLTPENLEAYWPHTDLFIIGSYIKKDGAWFNPIDPKRLKAFMNAFTRLRG